MSYYSTTKEQRSSLIQLGYKPIWVEDLTEGLEAALVRDTSHPSMQGVVPVEFFTVTNLKTSSTFQETEYGEIVEDSKRTLVKWFALFDDGDIKEFSIWQGTAIWIKEN